MSDNNELKRLAEAANAVTGNVSVDITISSDTGPNQAEIDAVTAFVGAATPAVVLALISENEQLRDGANMRAIRSLRGDCADLLAERDHLKAENELLRKDSARLDRLDQEREAYGTSFHEGNRWTLDGPFATVRDAIDAAMGNGEKS